MTATQDTHWLSQDEQSTWRSFLHMHASLMAQLSRELQDASGLSNADYAVLVQLSEQPGQRLRVLELARSLLWEKSRLSHQLTRMQQRGLLGRSSCPEDRRGAVVELTDAGRAAIAEVAPMHVESVRRYLFDGLDESQVAGFRQVCEAVLAKLASEVPSSADATGCCGSADD